MSGLYRAHEISSLGVVLLTFLSLSQYSKVSVGDFPVTTSLYVNTLQTVTQLYLLPTEKLWFIKFRCATLKVYRSLYLLAKVSNAIINLQAHKICWRLFFTAYQFSWRSKSVLYQTFLFAREINNIINKQIKLKS